MLEALNPPSTSTVAATKARPTARDTAGSATPVLNHYQIIRRNGAVVPFAPDKIAVALMKASCARGRAAVPSTSKTCRTRWSWA